MKTEIKILITSPAGYDKKYKVAEVKGYTYSYLLGRKEKTIEDIAVSYSRVLTC